jgi:DNA-binding CsgD family transcriptional regulator
LLNLITILQKSDSYYLKKINNIAKYWEILKPGSGIDTELETSWKKRIEFIDEISAYNNAVVFLWNVFTNRILYISDHVKVFSLLDPALYTAENGVEYSLSRVYPGHLGPGLELTQKFTEYCSENKVQSLKTLSLWQNYLYKDGEDKYMQVLQRNIILEVDGNNKPSLGLAIIYNAGHIKREGSVDGAICAPDKTSIFNYNMNDKCFYPPQIISEQEKKIIQLLAKGFDTKKIAELLLISPLTVNTHRRNLIKKTNCIDTTGVVTFARMIGLIQ